MNTARRWAPGLIAVTALAAAGCGSDPATPLDASATSTESATSESGGSVDPTTSTSSTVAADATDATAAPDTTTPRSTEVAVSAVTDADVDDVERFPIEPPERFRPTNDLVVERRVPTTDERDRLDDDGDPDAFILACDPSEGGAATYDYDAEIGPDDAGDRTSDDALREAIGDIERDPTGRLALTVDIGSGWTEWWFGPGSSTFVWTVDEPRIVVEVAGEPDLGAWRPNDYFLCASIYEEL